MSVKLPSPSTTATALPRPPQGPAAADPRSRGCRPPTVALMAAAVCRRPHGRLPPAAAPVGRHL
ncbi:hypothetical protein E2562_005098 [Oryza meyeriana var. granulata]|uniref:Uncharacterized protein n=1 Tax=Oryza meyeriana var. granulata TaxID=110450 RepID=A0A6G1BSJ9_9ORYZ|nr:hypothetical protein E2562_005098 [Oryza meyeriana var. granulata]